MLCGRPLLFVCPLDGPHRKYRLQQFLYCTCERGHGHVTSTEPQLSNGYVHSAVTQVTAVYAGFTSMVLGRQVTIWLSVKVTQEN